MSESGTAQESKVATLQKVVANTVLQLCMIINPAPLVDEKHQAEVKSHRGNTPWYICFPALAVTVMVTDGTGKPQCGYFSDREAEDQARMLWNAMRDDPSLREQYQAMSEFPTLEPGYKIMYRDLRLSPLV